MNRQKNAAQTRRPEKGTGCWSHPSVPDQRSASRCDRRKCRGLAAYVLCRMYGIYAGGLRRVRGLGLGARVMSAARRPRVPACRLRACIHLLGGACPLPGRCCHYVPMKGLVKPLSLARSKARWVLGMRTRECEATSVRVVSLILLLWGQGGRQPPAAPEQVEQRAAGSRGRAATGSGRRARSRRRGPLDDGDSPAQ